MNERSDRISRLLNNLDSRASYIRAKVSVLVPSQIRALRLKSTNPAMPYQRDLAKEAGMHQSRISMFETPGMANMTLETLSKIAAALRTGLIVRFVPFNEMLEWENRFYPESFDVIRLDDDRAFLSPDFAATTTHETREERSPYSLAGSVMTQGISLPDVMTTGRTPQPEASRLAKGQGQAA